MAAVLATARVDTLMLYLVAALRYVPVAALYDARFDGTPCGSGPPAEPCTN